MRREVYDFFSEDLMTPETYIYTVVLLIKGLAQLLELYPKLSSMWNDRSYNLDHSDHVHFLGGEKWRGFDRASGIKRVFFSL